MDTGDLDFSECYLPKNVARVLSFYQFPFRARSALDPLSLEDWNLSRSLLHSSMSAASTYGVETVTFVNALNMPKNRSNFEEFDGQFFAGQVLHRAII